MPHDSTRGPEWGLALFLAFLTGAVLVGAVLLMKELENWQGERFYVATAALLLLVGIESMVRRLVDRRQPYSLSTTSIDQLYSFFALFVISGAAFVLFGFACYLP